MIFKNIKEIAADVTAKTGIDFSTYKRPELVMAFVEAVMSVTNPMNIILSVVKSVFVTILLVNAGLISIWHQKRPELWVAILFFVVGNVGFAVVAIAIGVGRTIRRGVIKASEAMVAALELADQSLVDIEELETNECAPAPVDIIRGVLCVAIVPAVSEVISRKLGFVSKPMTLALDKFSIHMANALPKLLTEEADEDAETDSAETAFDRERYAMIIAKVKGRMEPFVRKNLLGKVTMPFKLIWALSSAITLTSLVAIYLFLM